MTNCSSRAQIIKAAGNEARQHKKKQKSHEDRWADRSGADAHRLKREGKPFVGVWQDLTKRDGKKQKTSREKKLSNEGSVAATYSGIARGVTNRRMEGKRSTGPRNRNR